MEKHLEPVGLYLHIPFCHARCGYCDFVTFTGKEDRIDEYVDDLCEEIRLYVGAGLVPARNNDIPCDIESSRSSGPAQGRPLQWNISTIFFGGGTPSLLEPRHVSQILGTVRSHFDLNPEAEITLEANPESVTREKASGWRAAGINRMSLGLQAYDDGLLKKMDRLHNVQQFLDAYRAVRDAGFSNVSVDLIYGFAEQTLEDWKRTLEATVKIQPEHLSLYALKIEEHTPFAARGYQVVDDLEAEMYEWARGYLKNEGFEQYEISNFSRPGMACRHNLIYWRQQDYLGVGVGAVGCLQGRRWENHKTLQAYHHDIDAGHQPTASSEKLDPKTSEFERLMLGLRLREGLEWNEKNPDRLARRADLASRNLLEETSPGRWRIPDAVVSLTNQVLLPFL